MTRHKLGTTLIKAAAPLALVLSASLLAGCATIDGAHVAATPWGAGGLYSFKDNVMKPRLNEPSQRKVDSQVAQALDRAEAQTDDVRVASR